MKMVKINQVGAFLAATLWLGVSIRSLVNVTGASFFAEPAGLTVIVLAAVTLGVLVAEKMWIHNFRKSMLILLVVHLFVLPVVVLAYVSRPTTRWIPMISVGLIGMYVVFTLDRRHFNIFE